MNIPEIYDYLTRARRDLWAALEDALDEVLSRPLLGGERFHCIKDLVFHIASVEDFWLHEDILREEPVLMTNPILKAPSSRTPRAALSTRGLRSRRCSTTGKLLSRAPSPTSPR